MFSSELGALNSPPLSVRMTGNKCWKISVHSFSVSSSKTAWAHCKFCPDGRRNEQIWKAFFSFFVPDFPRKVNISGIKYALVNVVINCPATEFDLIGMVCKYVAYRLPIKYQWREQFVQPSSLFFRSVNVFSRFRQESAALFIRFVGWIVCVLFSAVILLCAAGTYIRRLV